MLSNFGFVEDDFLHKIDLKALQKELGMSAEGIGRFLQMKKRAPQPDHPGMRFRVAGGKRFFSLYNLKSVFARKKENRD